MWAQPDSGETINREQRTIIIVHYAMVKFLSSGVTCEYGLMACVENLLFKVLGNHFLWWILNGADKESVIIDQKL